MVRAHFPHGLLALLLLPALLPAAALAPGCALGESGSAACDDDEDNDRDGRVDCTDPGCFLEPGCQPCGDGRVDDGEACDDGNLAEGDGCSSRCLKEGCPNGELEPGEACDDGNLEPGDGCDFRCEVDFCGNGRFDSGEACDDGNGVSGDGCSSRCTIEVSGGIGCGNGVFDAGEQCEDGNKQDGDGCSSACRAEFCGDNVRQPRLGEGCDGTDTPDGTECVGCRVVRCGNGVLDSGEECDDDNQVQGDGCGSSCRIERCGDGVPVGGEGCDDGNNISEDGCSATCNPERCGDGVLQRRLGELCDERTPDCVSCVPIRSCDEGLCFRVAAQQGDGIPQATALVRRPGPARPLAWVAYRGFIDPFAFDVDLALPALTSGRFISTNVNVMSAMIAGDFVADAPGDEVLLGLADGRVGRTAVSGGFAPLVDVAAPVIDVAVDGASDPVGVVAVLGRGDLALTDLGPTQPRPVARALLSTSGRRAVVSSLTEPQVFVAAGQEIIAFARATASTLVERGRLGFDSDVLDLGLIDVDGDGVRDLVVLTAAPDELHAVLLDANGLLPEAPFFLAPAPGADFLATAAMDGDAREDLVVTGRFGVMAVHLAASGFQRGALFATPLRAVRPAVIDVDVDGDTDILVAGFANFSPVVLLFLRE